ncbi:phage tail protein [Paenibacillus pini]|uniref:Microcystin dependent protein n=1 Tax=Paenibacillus pini JCM 16418 TaxID=1236976 RepID=W7YXL3_9BACL|nr:tail fiber protein [Paenibacillus pini]GAF09421.1 microcystin dependent protein [Paenibacillus pini JCM 16418]
MSEPFLGEIRLFPIHYAPKGWLFCEGQILPISTNTALFSLLGTVYGGDGRTTFALPDYRGRVPIHFSSTIPLGTKQGEAAHSLTVNEIPQHTHQLLGSSNVASDPSPKNNVWAKIDNAYDQGATLSPMSTNAIKVVGEGQAHNNMQPYLALNYAIAVQGIYPSRS